MYNRHLLPVLGPLVAQSSDGDSRRRKLHLINAAGLNGDRYKLEHENFTHSGKTSENAVENLSDQDYIYNGKKLINHLKHPSRVLSLGGNPCHMNHLELLLVNMQINQFDHGLNRADIERADRMNWESAQRVMFPRVRECLQRINSGQVQPKENVHGTIAYLLYRNFLFHRGYSTHKSKVCFLCCKFSEDMAMLGVQNRRLELADKFYI